MGRLCYPTQAPGSPEYSGWYFSRETVTMQGGYGALFDVFALQSLGEGGPGTSSIEHYAYRGTSLVICWLAVKLQNFDRKQVRGPVTSLVIYCLGSRSNPDSYREQKL
jgi:hypothetical protein